MSDASWRSIYTAPIGEPVTVWCAKRNVISTATAMPHSDGSLGWVMGVINDTEDFVFAAHEPKLWRPAPKPPGKRATRRYKPEST